MPPITPKERLPLSLPIHHPKPRAPERPQLLHDPLRRRRQLSLDLRRSRGGNNLLYFLGTKYVSQSRGQILRLRNVQLAIPHCLEAALESCGESLAGVVLFDVG